MRNFKLLLSSFCWLFSSCSTKGNTQNNYNLSYSVAESEFAFNFYEPSSSESLGLSLLIAAKGKKSQARNDISIEVQAGHRSFFYDAWNSSLKSLNSGYENFAMVRRIVSKSQEVLSEKVFAPIPDFITDYYCYGSLSDAENNHIIVYPYNKIDSFSLESINQTCYINYSFVLLDSSLVNYALIQSMSANRFWVKASYSGSLVDLSPVISIGE